MGRLTDLAAAGVALAPSSIVTQSVSLTVNLVTGDLINVGYQTPACNHPRSFGNVIHLWSVSAATVPWDRPPVASVSVASDQPIGQQNLDNLSINDGAYLAAYAVGPILSGIVWSPYADVVATAYIPPLASRTSLLAGGAEVFSASAEILFVGTTSLVFAFAFPGGFDAAATGAWAGLWQGTGASTVPPVRSSAIRLAADNGDWGLDGLDLVSGGTYTLGLFPTAVSRQGGSSIDVGDTRRLAVAVTFSV